MPPPVHGEMRHNVCPFVRLSVRSFVLSSPVLRTGYLKKRINRFCCVVAQVVQGGGQGDERINFSTKEVIFMQVKTKILGGGIILDLFGRFFVFKVAFNIYRRQRRPYWQQSRPRRRDKLSNLSRCRFLAKNRRRTKSTVSATSTLSPVCTGL